MSIIYRPHRGTLEDSLKEIREFKSLTELAAFLGKPGRGELVIDYYGYDDRCGWHNWIVCAKGLQGVYGWIKG